MLFDLSNFRTARIFWVVKTRTGQGVPGRISLVGDGMHADIRVDNDGSRPVTIANGDILSVKGGRVVRLHRWFCYYGHTPGDTAVDVWCARGDTTQHLVYTAGAGLGSPRPDAMSEAEFQSLQGHITAVVEAVEEEDD